VVDAFAGLVGTMFSEVSRYAPVFALCCDRFYFWLVTINVSFQEILTNKP
jgi:hypothetical protein